MDEKNKIIEFDIKGIFVTNFNINLKEEFIKENEKSDGLFNNFTFEINCKNDAQIPDELVNVETYIRIFLDEEKKIQLGSIQIQNIYGVKNLKDFYLENENKIDLPVDFEATLIGISLSHARAILITKCAGTFLQYAVLPILRPKDFLKKKMETQEKEELANTK